MPKLKKVAWLVLLPAVLAMFFVACGGDDDESRDSDEPTTAASNDKGNEDATKSASSDDKTDESKDDIKASGDTGSDKQYVAAICKSTRKYFDDFSAAFEKLDPEKPEEFTEAISKPIRQWAEDLADAKPPKDLKEWHEGMIAAMNDLVKSLESGDPESAFGEDVEYPDMPADAEKRLTKLAEENDDCKALEEEGQSIFE